MKLRVGTRGSRLSIVQTDEVIERLRQIDRKVRVEKVVISTKGDRDKNTPLYHLDEKGIFEKEVDQAVLDGHVDFAVHSLKDLPIVEFDSKLVIAAMPVRASPNDVLVSRRNLSLAELPSGSSVGTSSLLRSAQVKRLRSDLNPQPIRGNVETRIRKVDSGEYDAIILAEAGLVRLGLADRVAEVFSIADMLPAPGQGILALVANRDSHDVISLLSQIDDPISRCEGEAEREVARVLEGGCKVPIGVLADVHDSYLSISGCTLSLDGRDRLYTKRTGSKADGIVLAREVGNELLQQGAKKLEEGWRTMYA